MTSPVVEQTLNAMNENEQANEELLKEYVAKHEKGTCNCNEDTLELCLGGLY